MVITKDKNSTKSPSLQSATLPKPRVGKKLTPWLIGVAIVTFIGVGATYVISQTQKQSPTENIVPATKVTALGRLEPQGEVIKLSVANAQDSRVNKLLVEEGDRIKAGQVIAILQGTDKKQAELAEAKQNLAVQQAKLTQMKAGEAKAAEIAAQKARIAQLEAQLRTETAEKQAAIARTLAQLRNAQINYQRYQRLQQQGAQSISALDERREALQTAQARYNEAQAQLENTTSTLQEQIHTEKAMLEKLKEVRFVDVQVLQAEVERAIAQINRIKIVPSKP